MKIKDNNSTYGIVDSALGSKEPVKKLLEIAVQLIENDDLDALHDIDVMLSDRYLHYLRNGSVQDLKRFQASILPFIDSDTGDRLRDSKEGARYYYRWDHYQDLCEMAVENYDPSLVRRLVESRKQGKALLYLLHKNREGIRHNELARKLDVKRSQLARLLNAFQEQELIARERMDNQTTVRLGLRGSTYVLEQLQLEKDSQDVYKTHPGGESAVAIPRPSYENEQVD